MAFESFKRAMAEAAVEVKESLTYTVFWSDLSPNAGPAVTTRARETSSSNRIEATASATLADRLPLTYPQMINARSLVSQPERNRSLEH